MTLLEVLKTILGEAPIFGGDNDPYKVLAKINEASEKPFIDYSNFYLYKDQETAKIWFNALINRYYAYLCVDLQRSPYSDNLTLINFIISLFNKYEELYPKYKLLFDYYYDQDFKKKIDTDQVEITQTNQTEEYLMPQDKTVDDTVNNRRKGNSSNITKYNNNYFSKVNFIQKNINNLLSQWLDEFDDFFYKDWGYF